jgi:SET domain-containing protein
MDFLFIKNIKKQLIEEIKNIYVDIGISKIDGIGLIALIDIPNDTCILKEYLEVIYITYDELKENGVKKDIIKMLKKKYQQDEKGIYIPTGCKADLKTQNFTSYLNHSKNNNIKCINNNGTNEYYTIKNIKKGEEILINYLDDYAINNVTFTDKCIYKK